MRRRTFIRAAAAVALLSVDSLSIFRKGAFAMTVSPLGPLLDPWTGKYGGFPRFDQIKTAEFKPALLKGIDLKRGEIEAITASKGLSDFDLVIVPLEDSGRHLNRATRLYDIYTSTMNDKTMQSLESEM